tara:strand:+ start:232 stop:510 length:279 start_codon:yes stop_codon:yes gene_type:complete
MIRPLELTATASVSPKFISGEYLRKFETDSYGISGTLSFICCAIAELTNIDDEKMTNTMTLKNLMIIPFGLKVMHSEILLDSVVNLFVFSSV